MSSTQSPLTVDDSAVPTITIESSDYVPALVVIDVQNDFVSGSLAVPEAEAILPVVNSLIDLPFKARIATKDFHPNDHVSFAKTHRRQEYTTVSIYHPEDTERVLGIQQTLWPVHCVVDTSGAEFAPGLEQNKFDAVVHKGTHPSIESYSAFRDVWGRGQTELSTLLKEVGATDVYFCGLAGDYCVKYTAKDSIDFGYNTWVVRDAVKSISSDTIAWDEMEKKGVRFTTFGDVQVRLRSGSKS
ncbi:pyrazinamidase/nicotinamidase [Macrolepiota fuliginosa MF-IS2]|uniref:nicotinamidase n=1 Tax=Macrolepiota fuliginosa MF-IS2 TaxID=1400762 RepID=A0A9P5XNT6_9AGAR|nr:pyrazinamidase/nicotinamidase [Macrolepiota fuliginosa MF-IS2]